MLLFKNPSLIRGHIHKAMLHTRPRRALLYVPGADERKLNKVFNLSVDCVALDLEDGVASNKKDAARKTVVKFLSENRGKLRKHTDWAVRINSVDSGHLSEDLRTICSGAVLPNTLLLPKVDRPRDLYYFGDQLKQALRGKTSTFNLIIYSESCKSVTYLPNLLERAVEMSKSHPFRIEAVVFGSDDFCATLGIARTESSQEILYARQRVALVAKAFDLQAIDMVHINLNDEVGLNAQAREGASFGYTGKQVIHPKQVPIVQEAFMPSKEKIEWAQELLIAYRSFQLKGQGAFVFRGQMIDAPTMKQAENIISFVRLIERD